MVKVGQRYRMLGYNNRIMEVIAVKGDTYDCLLEQRDGSFETVRNVIWLSGGWVDTECVLCREDNVLKLLSKIDREDNHFPEQ